MLRTINCVVDTQDKTERKKLIDYVSQKNITISNIDDIEGFQLIALTKSKVGYIGVIVASNLVNKHNYKHFNSVDEYIQRCIKNERI